MQGLRAVGGNLYLTSQRFLFIPNRFETLLRRKPWSVPLDHIEGISLGLNYGGGAFVPPKLQVTTVAAAERFLVREPAAAALSLKNLLGR